MKHALRASLAALCPLGVVVTLAAHAAPQTTPRPAKTSTRIGPFNLVNTDGSITGGIQKQGGTTLVFRGPKLALTSARYDIAAPKITILLKRAVPQSAEAVGGVRIAIRNPEEQRDTTMTADTARYIVPKSGGNPRIVASGNVRTVLRGPDFDPNAPLVTTTREATIEFLPNGDYSFSGDGIDATGTPVEKPSTRPAPRKKP